MMRAILTPLGAALTLASGCAHDAAPPAPPTPPPASAPASAVLPHETFTVESKGLGEVRRINVYAPPGYATSTARYPVLYMPDGGVEEDFPHVVAAVDAAVRANEIRPVIVVGIENTERRRDMTPPTRVAADEKIAPRVGGAAKFRAFIKDELIPAVDARVRSDGHRAIMGESLAGLFILDTFLADPDLFDAYVALSPTTYWNDGALVKSYPAWRQAHPAMRAPRTLYLSVAGDDDVDGLTSGLAKAVAADPPRGLTFVYEPRPQEKHATIYRASEGPALRRVFPVAK